MQYPNIAEGEKARQIRLLRAFFVPVQFEDIIPSRVVSSMRPQPLVVIVNGKAENIAVVTPVRCR